MGVIEEVEAVLREFVALTKAGNIAKACELYADDATLGSSGSDLIIGRANITEFLVAAGFDPKGESSDEGTIVDLGHGYAHRVGRCSVVEKGKVVKYWYHSLFHKINGKWMFQQDATGVYE